MSSRRTNERQTRPELLAPAGDWLCARAAIENGADAIYFGLDCGFNARYRAQNFSLGDLPELMKMLRLRGVRGYATTNTLAFPAELPALAEILGAIGGAGVDAILVQDFGVARLAREICPDLEIHASTQMSMTSAETIAVASELGLSRVVLARELSVAEISKIAAATTIPLEVFIHGALCVAYSGQCLTSESLGGRSANRGQCAQACRLPYELVCDGEERDLGSVRYLLSPQDLAGYGAISGLIECGVASLKIEGRLKTPEYVANITGHYRQAIDQAVSSQHVSMTAADVREMELSFSRGFSPGWLAGNDHKRLVPGLHSSKRGIELGVITAQHNQRLQLTSAAPLALGDGLVIEADDEQSEGGRIYSLENIDHVRVREIAAGQACWIGFGRGEIDWTRIAAAARVFKNDDPQLNRRLRKTFAGERPRRRRDLDLQLIAHTGKPLRLTGTVGALPSVEVSGDTPLEAATKHPATPAMLEEKLGRLGGTGFQLGKLVVDLAGGPMVPASLLNQLRRALVEQLEHALERPITRRVDVAAGLRLIAAEPIGRAARNDSDRLQSTPPAQPSRVDPVSSPAQLAVLCRTLEQVESAARHGADLVYADFHDVRGHREAIAVAHERGVKIGLASIRIQKPGELGLLKALLKAAPDLVLARNLAALRYAVDGGVPVVADFSLNAANQLTVDWLHQLGAGRITVSYDLNRDQVSELVAAADAAWLEVVLHQHMPMFHMEHCVFCAVLSPGTNKTNCGRPCDRHVVMLRDRVGAEHPLQADIACRNTLYNASPQSGAEIAQDLLRQGVHWYRLELLEEDTAQTATTIDLYRRLLRGELSGRNVWEALQATNRLGVTRGTLETSRNPLAIL